MMANNSSERTERNAKRLLKIIRHMLVERKSRLPRGLRWYVRRCFIRRTTFVALFSFLERRCEQRQTILLSLWQLIHLQRYLPSKLHFQLLELLQESCVWRHLGTYLDYLTQGLPKRHPAPSHEVRRHDHRRARDSRRAMYENPPIAFV